MKNLKLLKIKIFKLISYVFLFIPISNNTILFDSFHGKLSDNPKYVEISLLKKMPNANIIWVAEKNNKAAFKGLKTVDYQSLRYFILLMHARVVVDNQLGGRLTSGGGKSAKLYSKIRKDQLCISSWHGTPLKRLGNDVKSDGRTFVYNSNLDVLSLGNKFTAEKMASAYEVNTKIKYYGTPRNDILFDKEVDTEALKKKLQLPDGYKFILFAPTFRADNERMSAAAQLEMLNLTRLTQTLEKSFGGKWGLIIRAHHIALSHINIDEIACESGVGIFNGNIGDDMAEYLVLSDILLTDYSSSMFDFALTKKPCFLFTPDRDEYENGYYFPLNTLPFPSGNSEEELLYQIEHFDQSKYESGVDKLLENIGNVEDGHACEHITDDIIDFIQTKKKSED